MDAYTTIALAPVERKWGRARRLLTLLITSLPTVACAAADRTPAGHMIVGHAPARQADNAQEEGRRTCASYRLELRPDLDGADREPSLQQPCSNRRNC